MPKTSQTTRTPAVQRLSTEATPLALYRAGVAPKSAKTLVLGHALGSDRHMWDQVLPDMPSDIQVILWEQPGHGQSGTLPSSALQGDQGVAAIAGSLRAGLQDVLGDDASLLYVAGLSLGGMVSLAFAQEFPETVAALAMFSSGPVLLPSNVWTDRAAAVRKDGLEPLVNGTMERWFSPGFANGAGAEAVERTRRTFLGTNPDGYAQCCDIIANTDLRPGVATTNLPVAVVVGQDDPGMTPAQGEELVQALPEGNLEVIAGARHLTAVECPVQVSHQLLDFLKA